VQVRKYAVRDGFGAVLGGLLTGYSWCLKCGSDLNGIDWYFPKQFSGCLQALPSAAYIAVAYVSWGSAGAQCAGLIPPVAA